MARPRTGPPPHPGPYQHPGPPPAPPYAGYQAAPLGAQGWQGQPPAPPLTGPHQQPVFVPTPGNRFVARVLDTIAFGITWFLAMLAATFITMAIGGQDMEGTAARNTFTALYVVNFFLLPVLLEWAQVSFGGRTVGKRIMGLWVVNADDGGKVTAGRALVRALMYAPGHTNLVNWLLPWSITNALWLYRDKERRRCLHDRAARTMVVQGTPVWARLDHVRMPRTDPPVGYGHP
ncbi:RDD family protein [Nocardiopsis lucentensis]|uniref:RDD family protein n=1 Tax=Nocardiopsis lucentensis TaxID=53441 RepID=UPI000380CF4B|nr:RDD family protein [Nocardiopsis lucentensis]